MKTSNMMMNFSLIILVLSIIQSGAEPKHVRARLMKKVGSTKESDWSDEEPCDVSDFVAVDVCRG